MTATLDYFRNNSSVENQEQGFRRHIAAARETGLPLVIHAREADDDVARILEEETAKGAFPFVLHCFTGGPDLAKRGLALGGLGLFQRVHEQAHCAAPGGTLLRKAVTLFPVPIAAKADWDCF